MKNIIFLWVLFLAGLIALFLPWQIDVGYGEQNILNGYNLIIGSDFANKISQDGIATTIRSLIIILPISGGYCIGILIFLASLIIRKIRLFRIASWLMLYGVIVTGLLLNLFGGFAGDAQYYSYLEIGYWIALIVTIICVYLVVFKKQFVESVIDNSKS